MIGSSNSNFLTNAMGDPNSNSKTTFPISSALHLAISTNCELFVRKLLNEGADPNEPLKVEKVSDYYDDRTSVSPSESIFRHDDDVVYQVFPIHVAIMNCYFNSPRGSGQRARALGIVQALMEYDADPTAPCFGVHFVRLGEEEFGTYVASAGSGKAFNLIASLKEYPLKGFGADCRDMMDDLTFLLLETKKEVREGGAIVPHAVKSIWSHLLHHETFNDITFVCQDGKEFPAHKCVLAAASDYFATAFQGPWKESDEEGKWPTAKPSAVIQLLLTYIYTGEFDETTFNEFSKEALETAFEFNVPAFQEICERSCAKNLNATSLRGVLLLATMYDATTLKRSCFNYVENNWTKVMFDPSVLSLSTEHPDMWRELAAHFASPIHPDEVA
jgi:hypothetical protein